MSQTPVLTHEPSIIIEATPETPCDLVSDITRTGEWSPIRTACWWGDPPEAGRVGAWFAGRNGLPERTWETGPRSLLSTGVGSRVDRGRQFRPMGFTFHPDGAATTLTEAWSSCRAASRCSRRSAAI